MNTSATGLVIRATNNALSFSTILEARRGVTPLEALPLFIAARGFSKTMGVSIEFGFTNKEVYAQFAEASNIDPQFTFVLLTPEQFEEAVKKDAELTSEIEAEEAA